MQFLVLFALLNSRNIAFAFDYSTKIADIGKLIRTTKIHNSVAVAEPTTTICAKCKENQRCFDCSKPLIGMIAAAHIPSLLRGNSNRRSFISVNGAAAVSLLYAPLASLAEDKLERLSNDKIADIVKRDIIQNQFLTNGRLTRSIYDERATFTDEIDTYTLDKVLQTCKYL